MTTTTDDTGAWVTAGPCPRCQGTPWGHWEHVCSICNGTPRRQVRLGPGEQLCPSCDGRGWWQGDTRLPRWTCTRCVGTGVVDAPKTQEEES